MNPPLQTPDFFALEAGEALDELETLLRSEREPAPDALLRTVRLLRGSALMAGQQPIARAAAAFETFVRSYRERPSTWNATARELVRQAIEEFRLLVRRVRQWDETDSARALRLGRGFELLTGGNDVVVADSDAARGTLQAGVRAFVAREGALIASALDRAARALRASPSEREPLYTVIRRMQSLRGLAELGELVPLPDVLDGIELAIGDLTRMFAPPPGVDEVVEAAAHALTRLSRDIAASGQPDAESVETRRFTELLVRVFAIERDVVPIESLYVDNDPAPLQQPVVAAGFHRLEALGPLELVSHGEHLCQTAELLTRSRSATERDLRLYQLLGTLRSVSPAGPDPVAAALGVFARAVRETLAAGIGDRASVLLVGCLRQAGELLRSVADSDDRALVSHRLLDVAYQLDQIRQSEPDVSPADDSDVVPIEQLLLVVPIEELLWSDPPGGADEGPVVPIESLAPDESTADTPSLLEVTFRTYGRLLRERPDVLPSLATFLRQSDAEPPEEQTVAIDDLCYRGRAALERAAAVRQQLTAELTGGTALSTVRPLLDELLDLVPLALTER